MFFYRIILIICILNLYLTTFSQTHFRIEADFSIKEKKTDGTSQLVIGKVYYDKNIKKLVYDISFPEKQVFLYVDSQMFCFSNNKITEYKIVAPTNELSVFHLCLNGNLLNYGLKNSSFKLVNVEKDSTLIISTWNPPKKFSNKLGKIMISQKNKKLNGVIFYDSKNNIKTKNFFNNYINCVGIEFPQEIMQITYMDGKEYYKQTIFKNIAIDETNNENFYNYNIPDK